MKDIIDLFTKYMDNETVVDIATACDPDDVICGVVKGVSDNYATISIYHQTPIYMTNVFYRNICYVGSNLLSVVE